jgi:hypothetical protein
MRARRGAILVYVLVVGMVLLMLLHGVLELTFGTGILRAKAIRGEMAKAKLDGAVAEVWDCLDKKGYPKGASCQPSAAQKACFPAGFVFSFKGAPPACVMSVSFDGD